MRKKPIGSTLLQRKKGGAPGKLNMIDGGSDLVTAKDIAGDGTTGAGSTDIVAVSPTQSGPPYSYSDTDSANCQSLGQMIASVENMLISIRLTPEGLAEYNNWLTYAKNRYNTQCVVVTGGGVVSVDNPPVIISDPNAPIEIGTFPTADQPGLVQTVKPPTNTPYPTGAAGGGGGSGAADDGAVKKRGYLLLLGIALMIGGAFIHSKS